MENWYAQETNDVLQEKKSSAEKGLTTEEAEKRLEEYGPNELKEKSERSP